VKIHLDGVNMRAPTGPNTFANRLAKKLFEMGHTCELEGASADVSLVFIEPSGAPLAKRVVQRLDGIWFKPHEFHTKNKEIQTQFYNADAVVFQSEFDKHFVEKWWGKSDNSWRPQVVIGNGIEINPLKGLSIPKLLEIRTTYDQVYVCSSNWHAQKRLEANVRLFHHLRKTHPNSCLFVMGDHPDYRATGPNVFYTGTVGPEVYMQVYSIANWMLHLAWADHCPNVVVEALSQGCPVACSEVGGTKELIYNGAYGAVFKEQPYDYELYDYDNPPALDVEQFKDLPTRQELDYTGIADMININVIAKQYIELFEKVCH
jgi:glycosyltransferase involved in cell wall biosynthesis